MLKLHFIKRNDFDLPPELEVGQEALTQLLRIRELHFAHQFVSFQVDDGALGLHRPMFEVRIDSVREVVRYLVEMSEVALLQGISVDRNPFAASFFAFWMMVSHLFSLSTLIPALSAGVSPFNPS